VRNPPLVTPGGLWLAPGSVERWGGPVRWDPFVDVSSDGGTTWLRAPIPVDHAALTGAGHIQPTLWWGRAGARRRRRGGRVGPPAGDGGVVTDGVGEYSYPSAVLDGDLLLVTYTWQRRGIVLVTLPITDLEDAQ